MTLKRILVSAYGCEPDKGSEQGVGWNWCLQLAHFAEVVVLTRSNNQVAIGAALPAELSERIRFVYYDLPQCVRRFKQKERGLYFYYLLWQWGAYQQAKKIVRHFQFDYVMQLTFGSIWMPSFMHRLSVPFIWGPIGGGEAVPFRLISSLPFRGRVSQYLRYLLMATLPVNPLIMGIIHSAKFILTRTEDTCKLIPARYRNKTKVVLETGVTDELLSSTACGPVLYSKDTLQVIYTGRLVPSKNVSTAIHAVARARNSGCNLELVIVGDGPLRGTLEALTRDLGLVGEITFRGFVTQAEVVQELRNSDVYILPSLKEGGVWSLMEAMSVGLPTVCINTSGMAVITDEKSAIRIDPVSQEQIIEDFAKALVKLSKSSELRLSLGESARKRIVEHFRWDQKGEFMKALFNQLETSS